MTNANDKKIRELKSILRSLQSMEMHPEAGVIEMRSSYNLPVQSRRKQNYNLPSLPVDQLSKGRSGLSLSTYLFTIVFSVILSSTVIALIVYHDTWFPDQSYSTIGVVKPSEPPQHKDLTDALLSKLREKSNRNIDKANRLIKDGKIVAARDILLKLAKNEAKFSRSIYAKVAISLARTYDINVLKTIKSPDAYPDIIEAEYWYKQWYKVTAENNRKLLKKNISR